MTPRKSPKPVFRAQHLSGFVIGLAMFLVVDMRAGAGERLEFADRVHVVIDSSESMRSACAVYNHRSKLKLAESVAEQLRSSRANVSSEKVETLSQLFAILTQLKSQPHHERSLEFVLITDGVLIDRTATLRQLCDAQRHFRDRWKLTFVGVCPDAASLAKLRALARLTCSAVELVRYYDHDLRSNPDPENTGCRCSTPCNVTNNYNLNCDPANRVAVVLQLLAQLQLQNSNGDQDRQSRQHKNKIRKLLTEIESVNSSYQHLESKVEELRDTIIVQSEHQTELLASIRKQTNNKRTQILRDLESEIEKLSRARSETELDLTTRSQRDSDLGIGKLAMIGGLIALGLLSLATWMQIAFLKSSLDASRHQATQQSLASLEESVKRLSRRTDKARNFIQRLRQKDRIRQRQMEREAHRTTAAGEFCHLAPIHEKTTGTERIEAELPIGTIAMWSGLVADIPRGWLLCDGKNGTPDLRGRFVIGASADSADAKYGVATRGGAERVILSVDEMPRHQHGGHTMPAGTHGHTLHRAGSNQPLGFDYGGEFGENSISAAADHKDPDPLMTNVVEAHVHELLTDTVGRSNAHENMPPYHALCYIMKTGE